MSGQVSRGSAGEYQADERAGVTGLRKSLLVRDSVCPQQPPPPDGAADILQGDLSCPVKPDPDPSQLFTQVSRN